MKKFSKSLLLGATCLFSNMLNAQKFQFAFVQEKMVTNYQSSETKDIPIAIDASGSAYVAGVKSTGSGLDVSISKIDKEGNLLWEMDYGKTNLNEWPMDIKVDNTGNIYICGYSTDIQSSVQQGFAVKFNASKTMLWEQSISGIFSHAQSTKLNIQNNTAIVLSSSTSDPIFYQLSGYENTLNSTGLVTFIDVNGQKVWQKDLNSQNITQTFLYDVVSDQNSVYVCGRGKNNSTQTDMFIAKLDQPNGKIDWRKFYNGTANDSDVAKSLALVSDGVIMTGSAKNTGTGYDVTTLKYKFNGKLAWSQTFNNPTNSDDFGVSMTSSGDSVYVASNTGRLVMVSKYLNTGELVWDNIALFDTLQGNYFAKTMVLADNMIYLSAYANISNANHIILTSLGRDGKSVHRWDYPTGMAPGLAPLFQTKNLAIDNLGSIYLIAARQEGNFYKYPVFKFIDTDKFLTRNKQEIQQKLDFIAEMTSKLHQNSWLKPLVSFLATTNGESNTGLDFSASFTELYYTPGFIDTLNQVLGNDAAQYIQYVSGWSIEGIQFSPKIFIPYLDTNTFFMDCWDKQTVKGVSAYFYHQDSLPIWNEGSASFVQTKQMNDEFKLRSNPLWFIDYTMSSNGSARIYNPTTVSSDTPSPYTLFGGCECNYQFSFPTSTPSGIGIYMQADCVTHGNLSGCGRTGLFNNNCSSPKSCNKYYGGWIAIQW